MKKRLKFWLIVLVIGVAGIALTGTYLISTGMLMSYEAEKEFALQGDFQKLKVDARRAQVIAYPTEGAPAVKVFAKAWVSGPIELEQHFSMSAENGILTVKEIPFESTFLGLFPQPYEMTMTFYVPQAIYDDFVGGRP